MKFLPLVWRNLLRRKVRTIFTLLSIFIAFVLFGVLMAIRMAFSMGVDMAGQGRLMVIDKVSIINPLPASYESQLKQVDGVIDVTHSNWFGGYYQEVKNQFATFAVDPESWLRVYPKEFALPEDQKKAWFADRTGAIVGIDTAKKFGWKVGQRVPIQGTIYRRPDGGPWEFTIDGIYDSTSRAPTRRNFFFHYEYLRETIPARAGSATVDWYIFTIADPDRAPQIAAKIDAMFANSPSETKTNTEKAFVVRLGEAGRRHRQIMMWIVGMALFTILLVAGNTMAQAVRERTNELARAQDARLRRRPHPGMVLLESMLIAIVGGGVRPGAVAWLLITRGRPDRRPAAGVLLPDADVVVGIALVLALGLAAGSLPALQASRLKIVDALRRN